MVISFHTENQIIQADIKVSCNLNQNIDREPMPWFSTLCSVKMIASAINSISQLIQAELMASTKFIHPLADFFLVKAHKKTPLSSNCNRDYSHNPITRESPACRRDGHTSVAKHNSGRYAVKTRSNLSRILQLSQL